jgi:opacity protein-like surface antigen
MKKLVFASACMLALASPAALAQVNQPSDGASSQGNVGPGASQDAMKQGKTTGGTGTTGAASSQPSGRDASTSGAQTGAPVNNTGTETQPGAVKDGINRR